MISLVARDQQLAELMDDPDADPVRLERTIRRFVTVNRLVSGWGGVYRTRMRPHLAGLARPVRILDVGCGGGDVLRWIVRLARRDGFTVDGVGIDPDARSLAVALAARTDERITFRQAHSHDLVHDGERFDIVVSNHVMHHLTSGELAALYADSEVLSDGLSLHSDIARGQFAYAAYAVGITPLSPGSFLRTDGLRSIRRSYTANELSTTLPAGWALERPAPFRLLAVHRSASVLL